MASTAVFQDWASWAFDCTVRGEQPAIAKYVIEKGSSMASEVRGADAQSRIRSAILTGEPPLSMLR